MTPSSPAVGAPAPVATVPIATVVWRQRARVHGTVRSVRVRPWGDNPTLELVVVDDTGGLTAVFLARRRLGGIRPGTGITLEGMVGAHHGALAMLNPEYTLDPLPSLAS